MTQTPTHPRRRMTILVVAVALTALVTFGLTALLLNILQHKTEAATPYAQVVKVDDTTDDPAQWGKNFPIQYEMYKKTSDMSQSPYRVTRQATPDDPRTELAVSKLDLDPRLVKMWAGYAFSVDYRHARGHEFMLEDQRLTKRVKDFKQPGTCLNCHASTYVLMKDLGKGDLNAGFSKMNQMTYADATKLAKHPVGCIDCHEPNTMKLRISRPAFINGIKAAKAAQGVKDYDVNRDATPGEMRSFVCGQCHVEYYFKKDNKELTFPWKYGTRIDQIMKASDEVGHVDFVHATTGAKILKAQHPEFDIWQQGVHASAGVSCADCHMPYTRVGAMKVSQHQIQSPLNNISASCGTCHHDDPKVLKGRVTTIQDRFKASRDRSFDALIQLIDDIEKAQKSGAPADRLDKARDYQRKASFYIDYLYSENSYGFHAPDYTQGIFNDAIDFARKGQVVLAGGNPDQQSVKGPVSRPTPATAD